MSSTPLLGVGVKDLLQQQLRNLLNPCMGCPFADLLIPWRGGESRTWTRWAAKSHPVLGSLEEASCNRGNISRHRHDLCRDQMRVWDGGKSTAMPQGKSWFSCRSIGKFWLMFSWEGTVKENTFFLLLATCTGWGKHTAIILQQTWWFSITSWGSTSELAHPMPVLLEN